MEGSSLLLALRYGGTRRDYDKQIFLYSPFIVWSMLIRVSEANAWPIWRFAAGEGNRWARASIK